MPRQIYLSYSTLVPSTLVSATFAYDVYSLERVTRITEVVRIYRRQMAAAGKESYANILCHEVVTFHMQLQ